VASRIGGVVDVLEDGRSGILVEAGDANGLAAALGALFDLPDRGAALGAAARQTAQRGFDERDNLARYRELFAEIGS
jgi:glycosyltransferase involved in cell wall biosynthesis